MIDRCVIYTHREHYWGLKLQSFSALSQPVALFTNPLLPNDQEIGSVYEYMIVVVKFLLGIPWNSCLFVTCFLWVGAASPVGYRAGSLECLNHDSSWHKLVFRLKPRIWKSTAQKKGARQASMIHRWSLNNLQKVILCPLGRDIRPSATWLVAQNSIDLSLVLVCNCQLSVVACGVPFGDLGPFQCNRSVWMGRDENGCLLISASFAVSRLLPSIPGEGLHWAEVYSAGELQVDC